MKHYEFIYKLFRDYKHARKGKRANVRSYLGSKIKQISVVNEGHFCKAAGGKFQTFIFWSCMLFWDSFFCFFLSSRLICCYSWWMEILATKLANILLWLSHRMKIAAKDLWREKLSFFLEKKFESSWKEVNSFINKPVSQSWRKWQNNLD